MIYAVRHRSKRFSSSSRKAHFGGTYARLSAAVLVLALSWGTAPRSDAAQRGDAAISDPAQALGEALTAACRQDQTAFANHLTNDNARAYLALPENQRVALLKRFVLLEDQGKPLLSTLDGHTVVRCEAAGVISEMRLGEAEVRDNLAFIPVTVPVGEDKQSVRFGLVRESGQWKLVSLGLLLLDIPSLAREWAESDLRGREQNAVGDLRKIAGALKKYQTAYGKLPETLEQLGPPAEGGFSPENAGLLDADLAKGNADGYQYRYTIVPEGGEGDESARNKAAGFMLAGTPIEYGKDGRRSFLLNSSGTLRGGDKNGAIATADDPRVESEDGQP